MADVIVVGHSKAGFQILKPVQLFKRTNEKDQQILWRFSRPEITWQGTYELVTGSCG